MMNLLIIDDEQFIRDGMKNYISSLNLGFSEIVTCESGIQALSILDQFTPNIVIADLLMPEMDGIETIGRIYQICPKMQVIIVSGCVDFSFARHSLQFPVIDYIPKPVAVGELTDALSKAIQKINEMKNKDDRILKAERIISGLDQLQEQLLRSLLTGHYLSNSDDLHHQIESLYISDDIFISSQVLSVSLRDISVSEYSPEDFSIIDDAFRSEFSCDCIVTMDEKHFSLIHKNTGESIETRVNKLLNTISENHGIKCSVGISELFEGISNLHEAYSAAYDAMRLAQYTNNAILLERDVRMFGTNSNFQIDNDFSDKIRAAMITGNTSLLHSVITDNIRNRQEANIPSVLWQAKLIVMSTFISTLQLDSDTSHISLINDLDDVIALEDFLFLADWLEEHLLIIMRKETTIRETKTNQIISDMKDVIESSFNQQLSLQLFSERTGLSENYLSQLFLQYAKVPFIKYLTRVRMKHAVELLETTSDSIGTIASSIGYEDPNYFSRVFRKSYGVSPAEYRGKFQ